RCCGLQQPAIVCSAMFNVKSGGSLPNKPPAYLSCIVFGECKIERAASIKLDFDVRFLQQFFRKLWIKIARRGANSVKIIDLIGFCLRGEKAGGRPRRFVPRATRFDNRDPCRAFFTKFTRDRESYYATADDENVRIHDT